MKPKNLFVADGVIATVLGAAFVLLPGLSLSMLGVSPRNQATQLQMSRENGPGMTAEKRTGWGVPVGLGSSIAARRSAA